MLRAMTFPSAIEVGLAKNQPVQASFDPRSSTVTAGLQGGLRVPEAGHEVAAHRGKSPPVVLRKRAAAGVGRPQGGPQAPECKYVRSAVGGGGNSGGGLGRCKLIFVKIEVICFARGRPRKKKQENKVL